MSAEEKTTSNSDSAVQNYNGRCAYCPCCLSWVLSCVTLSSATFQNGEQN